MSPAEWYSRSDDASCSGSGNGKGLPESVNSMGRNAGGVEGDEGGEGSSEKLRRAVQVDREQVGSGGGVEI